MRSSSAPDARKIDLWTWSPLIVALASYLVAVHRQQAKTVDDAFISFRFAQHLADGHGLVWNVGGPATEGYTNFLWILILAAFHALGVNLELAAPIVMTGVTVASAGALLWIIRRQFGPLHSLSVAVVALYLADSFSVIHTVSGLETPLAVLLLAWAAGAALELTRRPSDRLAIAVSIPCVLLVLTRPDMALFVGGLSVALLSGRNTIGDRRLLVCLGTIASALGVYAAWKLWYFGYLLPNPFYVKAAPGGMLSLRGVRPVLRFLAHLQEQMQPLWIPLLLVMLVRWHALASVWADVKGRLADTRVRIAALTVCMPPLLGWLYYLTIIHEVGFAGRFSFPTYPFVILCGAALATLIVAHPALVPVAAQRVAVLIVIVAIAIRADWRTAVAGPGFPSDVHTPFADALERTKLGPKVSLTFMAAGLIPYRSGVNHVDPVGLVDNDLCGRIPLTRESYEHILWSRPADIYVSAEPPASPGAAGPNDDGIFQTPYMIHLLADADPVFKLAWRHPRFGPISASERRVFLHRRMRLLRDEWVWLGEHSSEPLWTRLGFRLFVYVRQSSPYRDQLVQALRPVADIPVQRVNLRDAAPSAPDTAEELGAR